MIRLTDTVWIGSSADVEHGDLDGVGALFNVANDLKYQVFDDHHKAQEDAVRACEYAQVGLVDGPGNLTSTYCAAVLVLDSLLDRHDVILVYDHDGCRALVVAMMYLNLREGQYRREPLTWSHWMTWQERITASYPKKAEIIMPHTAHIEAFNKLPYGVLEALL